MICLSQSCPKNISRKSNKQESEKFLKGFLQLRRNCYNAWLRKNNPDYAKKQDENVSKWVKENRDRRKKHQTDWVAKQDPEYNRRKSLRRYGMTIEDYDRMLNDQNGVCAICGKPPKNGKSLYIDHDHDTGQFRGLLCFRCNFGLSYFSKDKNVIKKLYEYFWLNP